MKMRGAAMTLEQRLEKIETLLMALIGRQETKEWYSVEEAAKALGKAEFTVRGWCRLGRILAIKKASGRGAHCGWAISNEEVLRYRKEGLRPLRRAACHALALNRAMGVGHARTQ